MEQTALVIAQEAVNKAQIRVEQAEKEVNKGKYLVTRQWFKTKGFADFAAVTHAAAAAADDDYIQTGIWNFGIRSEYEIEKEVGLEKLKQQGGANRTVAPSENISRKNII